MGNSKHKTSIQLQLKIQHEALAFIRAGHPVQRCNGWAICIARAGEGRP